jgi:hypothetical protein
MTGQIFDPMRQAHPPANFLDVLSEICNTLSTLWHTLPSVTEVSGEQAETIFTGFTSDPGLLLKENASQGFHYLQPDLVFEAEVRSFS